MIKKIIQDTELDKEKFETTVRLIEEVKQIAKAIQIVISNDIAAITLNKLKTLPFDTTSSMHTDIKNNKPNNELKSLTEYVVNAGQEYHLETPVYNQIYAELKKKNAL